jgi:hypothetical protein
MGKASMSFLVKQNRDLGLPGLLMREAIGQQVGERVGGGIPGLPLGYQRQ